MFKRTFNRGLFELRIETRTPLLIRAGDPGLEPGPDLACVRTRHARLGPTVYIPGSSLKGVVRSAAEAFVRGQTLGGVEGACDPFDRETSCSARAERTRRQSDRVETAAIHREHCLACRTFGSTSMKGRASIRDHYPIDPRQADGGETFTLANLTEGRHGVAINRISGAAERGALYDMEVVPAGSVFFGDIALENYQAWQLGLVVAALDELNDGFAQLGSAKSRGLGVVAVTVTRILHEQPTRAGSAPVGVGGMVEPAEADGYGLLREGDLGSGKGDARGLSTRFEYSEAQAVGAFLEAARAGLRAIG